jgi:hypothetical protein
MPDIPVWGGRLAVAAALLAAVGASVPKPRPPLATLIELASPAAPGSAEPDLAVAPGGRVYLTWLEPAPDSAHALRFAVLDGDAFGAPRTIASGRGWFVNWADFPSLAATSDTELTAHWLVKNGRSWYDYRIEIGRSLDGGRTWSQPVVPHRDAGLGEHGFVSLLPGRGGLVHAIWLDGRKSAAAMAARQRGDSSLEAEMTLRHATLDRTGRLSEELELDGRICDCCQTSAVLVEGNPVVVYRDRSPDGIRDISVVRRVGTSWTEPRPVAVDGWRIPACPVNGPAIAAHLRQVAVAWFTAAGGQKRVYAAFSADGGATFGRKVRVDDGRPVGRVDVVMDDDGRALVSWLEETAEAADVRVRRVGPDGNTGRALVVARSSGARPAGFPRMARSGERVVFAWTEPAGAGPSRVRVAAASLTDIGR